MSNENLDSHAGPPPVLPTGRFSGREAFAQLVRDAIATAAREGWKEILVSDANFHDWPLGERSVVEALQDWAHGSRRFTMLACSYDEVVRRHARFVRWRGTWDHIITCRRSPSADPLDIPSALWSPQWVMQRLDPERCVGVTGSEPDRRVLLRETLNEWLRSKSTPGFPASTLGL
ncbi:hypothetical protein [Acidovorax sp.]|jgi:hypothetical protein|uniref:hypothetical protein n=1 Tax=Acidovorax sp. TaxID=1872122 RepID=UPI0025C110D7|nr:hypothetical protein [Acidovorax sp.]MCI5070620.1 hypothetical protein [Acidovorax sp.]